MSEALSTMPPVRTGHNYSGGSCRSLKKTNKLYGISILAFTCYPVPGIP